MFRPRLDSVSNIHRRWSFTRLNPSSYRISYIVSILCGAAIILLSQYGYNTKTEHLNLISSIFLGIAFLTATNFIDHFALRDTPLNKISKIFHISAFANLLWFFTVLIGATYDMLFSKNGTPTNYIIEGMSLAIGLRIGIFTSVIGASLLRATATSLIQPVIFLFSLEYTVSFYQAVLASRVGIEFGLSFLVIAIVWTVVADRAGRPNVESTFRLLQAFLAAWTENKRDMMETIAELRAHDEVIDTYVIKFRPLGRKEVSLVLPQVHPGPFKPIGGSDLPYALYNLFSKTALIFHSVSDHSFNIPSKKELDKYLQTLSKQKTNLELGERCTIPVEVKIGEASVVGIAFGNSAIVMLSMAPKGMEDIPEVVGMEIRRHGQQIGIRHTLVIDSHNAMGDVLSANDRNNLIMAGRQCLDRLKNAAQHEFNVGFANSIDLNPGSLSVEDLGQAGLAVVLLEIRNKRFILGWADSNNMERCLREEIINKLNSEGTEVIELCTSDTHSTSGKRTREGYFSLGNISDHSKIASIFFEISREAIKTCAKSSFELLLAKSNIKVMGNDQFDDYSAALDKSMNITKIFLLVTVAVFLAMLLFN